MATNTLNTRIVICSKTTTQWASTATVPMKGEVCLEWTSNDDFTIPPKVKVGNGTDTYANLPYATLTQSEIQTLINQSSNADVDGIRGSKINRYGVCSTESLTAEKAVSITSGSINSPLETGTMITVTFTNRNTANSPKLNVNSTGAKSIKYHGYILTSADTKTILNGTVSFVYNGTSWEVISEPNVLGIQAYTGTGTQFTNLNNFDSLKINNATLTSDSDHDPGARTIEITINPASDSQAGIVQLTDSTSLNDSTVAASAAAVKAAMDAATGGVTAVEQDGVTGATAYRYAPCSTAAGTAAKTASITTGTFALNTGSIVLVKFANKNTANSPTLNINSTGAKNIFHNGAQITTGTNKGMLYGTCEFVYDGTQWQLVGNYVDTTYNDATTTTHGLMSTADKTKLNSIENNADYTQIPIVTDKTTATDSTSTIEDATNALGFKFNNATIGTWEEVTRNARTVNVRNITIDDATTSQKGIVKLSSATDSTSEILAATPKAVKAVADAAMPKSGGTFTGAVTLNADPTANMHAATKKYVDDHIAASDAMVFKGTLGTGGTVTAVPTSNVTKGDTYKIITAGTWAGYSGCKVGDLLIAMTTGTSVTANTTNWAYVPSGDEAVTTLKYSTTAGEVNVNTTAQTGALVVGGAAIKQVDADTMTSTSTNLPTSKAVATYVSGATANKANTLTTPRTIAVGGSATSTATSFDGSQNITIPLTGVDTNILYQTAGNTLVIDGNFT